MRAAWAWIAVLGATLASGADSDAVKLRKEGFRYYQGDGVKRDDARALEYFEKAARAGDAESAFNLGKMYEYGLGAPLDKAKSASWYGFAAERGDRNAQAALAIMLYMGEGLARDRVEAAKWWSLALAADDEFTRSRGPTFALAEAKMSAEDLAEAHRRAAEWRARHP